MINLFYSAQFPCKVNSLARVSRRDARLTGFKPCFCCFIDFEEEDSAETIHHQFNNLIQVKQTVKQTVERFKIHFCYWVLQG